MTTENSTPPASPEFLGGSDGGPNHLISIADQTLAFRAVAIGDATPTGAQIARAAGKAPAPNVVVMAVLPDGQLELVRPDKVVDLRRMRGLVAEDNQHAKLGGAAHERVLVEAVVSPECPLIGMTVRESRFRTHYGAAIIAIARGDVRLSGKLGDVVLAAGDTLLLEARPAFMERVKGSRDFFLASKVDGFSVEMDNSSSELLDYFIKKAA